MARVVGLIRILAEPKPSPLRGAIQNRRLRCYAAFEPGMTESEPVALPLGEYPTI
ncbi:MAG: hypothetical protein P8M72_01250 [Gammaproteobacteria bacterium]|nr:hypothetical protein [Gammaproteobacteria bacterium]